MAQLAAGGLVLPRTTGITLRAEDLLVSTKKIAVTDHFLNQATNDQTLAVAFPMPGVRLDFINGVTDVPFPGTDNYLGFSTTVDGKPAVDKVELKAYGNGADQTALLNSLHIPIYRTRHMKDSPGCLPRYNRSSSSSASRTKWKRTGKPASSQDGQCAVRIPSR